jgi:hypothetical protein
MASDTKQIGTDLPGIDRLYTEEEIDRELDFRMLRYQIRATITHREEYDATDLLILRVSG